jgi:hypothetical protein
MWQCAKEIHKRGAKTIFTLANAVFSREVQGWTLKGMSSRLKDLDFELILSDQSFKTLSFFGFISSQGTNFKSKTPIYYCCCQEQQLTIHLFVY